MSESRPDENVISSSVLGYFVIILMFALGGALAWTLQQMGVPFGGWIGALIGGLLGLGVFVAAYVRYYGEQSG